MSEPEPAIQSHRVLAWFASNHVAANVLMVFVLLAGFLALWNMRIEVFQSIDPELIRVQVAYPGASPQEVEEGICLRVEEAIKGIDGIKRIRSVASEGLGVTVAELADYADDQDVLERVKSAVDQILDFPPQDAEEPVVVDVDSSIQVISVVIYGQVPLRTLKELADQVRDELTAFPTISLVQVTGVPRYEISIEVSEEALRRHGLTFTQMADAVRRSSLDLPAGSIKTEGGEFLLRNKGQRYRQEDFGNIVVISRADGTTLHLDDVAGIVDGFEESDTSTLFDGKPAVLLQVFRVGEQGALALVDTVQQYVASRPLPHGVQMATWFNRADYLRGRMNLLIRNGLIGLALLLVCLVAFLQVHVAFWTMLGIPISFLGGFLLMHLFGVSINMISLFALIVVLGIVVDDAIVIGENIYAYRQKGLDRLEAAIKGVQEMAGPVTLTVLTTIAAFAPLMYASGQLGKILWPIPVVVTSVLIISLLEALFILPAHLSTAPLPTRTGPLTAVQNGVRRCLDRFVDGPYRWALGCAVKARYLSVAIAVALLLVTLGFIKGGHIGFRFMPDVDADNVWAAVQMPQGTPVDQTNQIVQRLELAIHEVGRQLLSEQPGTLPIIQHISTTIGQQPFSSQVAGGHGSVAASAGHLAEVNVQLLDGEQRSISSRRIAQLWRHEIERSAAAGVARITFNSQFFSAGQAVNIQLAHQRFEQLLQAADRLQEELASMAGVHDIADTFELGKRELQISLRPAGLAAGLRLEDLARQVRQAFYGEEAQRLQRGRDEIKVMVRFPRVQRRSLQDMDQMRIRLPDGTEVPFTTVAAVQEGRGFSTINRVDRRRAVNVTADVDEATVEARQINRALQLEVLPALKNTFAGLTYSFEGEQREQIETLTSLGGLQLIALAGIFAMLAVQFRSYVQPLIVMSVIPFGLVGAVLGHLIMSLDLSLLSGFGVVALTGVVVNDSLIMIDLINRRRRQQVPLRTAVLESGMRRFRPILLTTLTTFLGLMPLILERSLQAQFLIPMAVSLGFGVLFATGITLLLVPAIYFVLEDVRRKGNQD